MNVTDSERIRDIAKHLAGSFRGSPSAQEDSVFLLSVADMLERFPQYLKEADHFHGAFREGWNACVFKLAQVERSTPDPNPVI